MSEPENQNYPTLAKTIDQASTPRCRDDVGNAQHRSDGTCHGEGSRVLHEKQHERQAGHRQRQPPEEAWSERVDDVLVTQRAPVGIGIDRQDVSEEGTSPEGVAFMSSWFECRGDAQGHHGSAQARCARTAEGETQDR